MKMSIAETMELVCRHLQDEVGDKDLTREEIVRRVVYACGCSSGSVLPSDHCHDRTNKGVRRAHVPFLQHVGSENSGLYRYVGLDYHQEEMIDHYPAGGEHRKVPERLLTPERA